MVSLIICFELDVVNNLLSMLSNSLLKPFALLLGLSTPVLHSRLLQYLAQITAVLDGDYYSTWPKYWHCSDHSLTQLLFKTLAYIG